jgi:hypothetical protein
MLPPQCSLVDLGEVLRGDSEYHWCREPHGIYIYIYNNLLIIFLGHKLMCFFFFFKEAATSKETNVPTSGTDPSDGGVPPNEVGVHLGSWSISCCMDYN